MIRGVFSLFYAILSFVFWPIKILLMITFKIAVYIFLVLFGALILLIFKKR